MFYPYIEKLYDSEYFVIDVYSSDSIASANFREFLLSRLLLSRLKYHMFDGTFSLCNDYTFGMTGQNIIVSQETLQDIFKLQPGDTLVLNQEALGKHRMYRGEDGILYTWIQLTAVSIMECKENKMMFCSPIEEIGLKRRINEIITEHDRYKQSQREIDEVR